MLFGGKYGRLERNVVVEGVVVPSVASAVVLVDSAGDRPPKINGFKLAVGLEVVVVVVVISSSS